MSKVVHKYFFNAAKKQKSEVGKASYNKSKNFDS